MANVDLDRAKRLLRSAKDLFDQGDIAGVAGLAYQAFESAFIALTIEKNGVDAGSHSTRRERAKALLSQHRDKIETLWEIRNIDFYGNPQPTLAPQLPSSKPPAGISSSPESAGRAIYRSSAQFGAWKGSCRYLLRRGGRGG